ncbi:MAG: glycosyltransferase [Psychroserpens sp.]
MNKVSVIIPVFIAMPFLKETVTSVFEQSHTNIEMIAFDDSPTDWFLEYL